MLKEMQSSVFIRDRANLQGRWQEWLVAHLIYYLDSVLLHAQWREEMDESWCWGLWMMQR